MLREMWAEGRAQGTKANEVCRPRRTVLVRDYVATYDAVLGADVSSGRLRAKTAGEYGPVLRVLVLPVLGHRKLCEMVASDGDALAAYWAERGMAPATCRREMNCLVRLLRSGERDHVWIAARPTRSG